MIRFERGKSYIYLFPVVVVLFMLSHVVGLMFSGNPTLGTLIMPALMAYLLASEIRSGVAIDSWWRAVHVRGSDEYCLMIIWHVVGLAFMTAFSVFSISSWGSGH